MPDLIPGRPDPIPSPEEFNRQLKEIMPKKKKKKSPEECKKYVELVAGMSIDYLMGKLTIEAYVSNLKLIAEDMESRL